MITKSHKQFDLFSNEQSLWQRQSNQTKSKLTDQLALLLLSCLNDKEQLNQQYKEKQPCQVK